MNFGLKFEKDCSVPSARCEVCDTEITDAERAMVYWRWEDYQKEFHQPLLVHKPCMSARRSLDEDYALSMEPFPKFSVLRNQIEPAAFKTGRNVDRLSFGGQLDDGLER
jgi:hypothetical protein